MILTEEISILLKMARDGTGDFLNGLAWVNNEDVEGNRERGYIDKTGTLAIPMGFDYSAPMGGSYAGRYYWVANGSSLGYFETPFWIAYSTDKSVSEDANERYGYFPGPLVASGATIMVIVAIMMALILKNKKPFPAHVGAAAPELMAEQKQPAIPSSEPSPEFKFCTRCGMKVPMSTNFCPNSGKQMENGEG